MNRKRVLIIFNFLVGIVIVAGFHLVVPAQSDGKASADREQDVLLKLLTANVKRAFGKTIDNGFEVTYEIAGKSVTASSVGGKLSNLRIAGIELNEQSAMVRAVTEDKALEITTYFFLNTEKQKLTIDRRVRNTGETVNLKLMREHVDPQLVLDVQSSVKQVDLEKTALEAIKAGQRLAVSPKEDKAVVQGTSQKFVRRSPKDCECPDPPPPCKTILCGGALEYAHARLIDSTRVFILEWTILGEKGRSVPPVTEVQSVTVLPMAGLKAMARK